MTKRLLPIANGTSLRPPTGCCRGGAPFGDTADVAPKDISSTSCAKCSRWRMSCRGRVRSRAHWSRRHIVGSLRFCSKTAAKVVWCEQRVATSSGELWGLASSLVKIPLVTLPEGLINRHLVTYQHNKEQFQILFMNSVTNNRRNGMCVYFVRRVVCVRCYFHLTLNCFPLPFAATEDRKLKKKRNHGIATLLTHSM